MAILRVRTPQGEAAANQIGEKMSKEQRIKEEIGWMKVPFGIFLVAAISLLAWLAQNYVSANSSQLVLGYAGLFAIGVIVVWLNHAVIRRFKQLEEMQ